MQRLIITIWKCLNFLPEWSGILDTRIPTNCNSEIVKNLNFVIFVVCFAFHYIWFHRYIFSALLYTACMVMGWFFCFNSIYWGKWKVSCIELTNRSEYYVYIDFYNLKVLGNIGKNKGIKRKMSQSFVKVNIFHVWSIKRFFGMYNGND